MEWGTVVVSNTAMTPLTPAELTVQSRRSPSIHHSKRCLEVMVDLMKEKHRAKECSGADFLDEPFDRGLSRI